MNCKDLMRIYRGLADEDFLVLASMIVYLTNKCIGRVRLAKELGITERKARNIIDMLTKKGIIYGSINKCIVDELMRYYVDMVNTRELDNRKITFFKVIDQEIASLIEKHVVDLRDYIILAIKDPHAIEIIGYVDYKGEIHIPGVPVEYYGEYEKLLYTIDLGENTAFIIWRKYRKYYCEASLIYGLYMLCSRHREV